MSERAVFLSYATIDDEVPNVQGTGDGWVTVFEELFLYELRAAGKKDIIVWRDETALKKWRDLGESIEDALKGCCAFVGIMSPVYVQQQWCKREIELFDNMFGNEACIFKIEKRPVDLDKQPDGIKSRAPFKMYEERPNRPIVHYYHPNQPPPRAEFVDEVQMLVSQLIICLSDPDEGATDQNAGAPPAGSKSVYLARPAVETQEYLRKIDGELTHLDFNVVATPSSAAYSVHLIGGKMDDADVKTIKLDLDEAKTRGTQRVIWVPTYIAQNEEARNLLTELSTGDLSVRTDEFIEGSFSQLKEFFHEIAAFAEVDKAESGQTNAQENVESALNDMTPEQIAKILERFTDTQ